MMRRLSMIALAGLSVLVAAVYLPLAYDMLFLEPVEKTHLFYSPVLERFVYKEKLRTEPPPEALALAEDHHAEIAYRDQDGTWYARQDFEKLLPFIYYKNMELWGLLPLHLGGRVLDKKTIQDNRQVLELKPGEIGDRRPDVPLWPLIESVPGQVRLVFPEDRFRMTDTAMEFVNADYNRVDPDLTRAFTGALENAGFAYPARSVHGKFTVLKPFDEGVFIVDRDWRVFHVKRVQGEPVVVRTPIDPALHTRHIKISENKRKVYYGLLLAGDGSLHLLTYDNYSLMPMPLDRYDPKRMDFKLIVNPLYRTAVYSDDAVVRAVAMDAAYHPLARYEHVMSRAVRTPAQRVRDMLFPFVVRLERGECGYMEWSVSPGSAWALAVMACCIMLFVGWRRSRRRAFPVPSEWALVACCGVYGLIAVPFLDP